MISSDTSITKAIKSMSNFGSVSKKASEVLLSIFIMIGPKLVDMGRLTEQVLMIFASIEKNGRDVPDKFIDISKNLSTNLSLF